MDDFNKLAVLHRFALAGSRTERPVQGGPEQELVDDLKYGRVDLVIGGITSTTPWTADAGATEPFRTVTDESGTKIDHIMLVPRGENAFLLELDKFLLDRERK